MSIWKAYRKRPATNTADTRVEISILIFYHSGPTPSASRLSSIATQTENLRFKLRPVPFLRNCEALAYALFDDSSQRAKVAVARMALFDALARQKLPVTEFRFDGEIPEAARRRRLLRWTPVRASAQSKTAPQK
jgi:hypothetical protein